MHIARSVHLLGVAAGALCLLAIATASQAEAPSCRNTERFSPTACRGRKAVPDDVNSFLARPSRSEWEAQLELGWGGSDGSTAALDHVVGVPIGATSRQLADVDLPANRHDWYYELGRSYGLGERFRKAADDAFRDMCLERVAHLRGLRGWLARADILGRHALLRLAGLGAWRARPGPVTPAGPAPQLAGGGS